MKLFLIAGETSGDIHGSELVRSLKAIDGGIDFVGIGGEGMEEAGVRLLHNPIAESRIGFVENLKKLPYYLNLLKRVYGWIDAESPDLVLLIDFPGFNMRVADFCKSSRRRCAYYIPPTAWAWGRKRAVMVAETTDLVISTLPFEADLYRRSGAKVEYVGHPLVDMVRRSRERDDVRRELDYSASQYVIGLMPGSRRQELSRHLEVMLDSASDIKRSFEEIGFILPLAVNMDRRPVESEIAKRGLDVRVVQGHNYDYMGACDILAVASGTATLEAALLNLPMVIIYRVSFITGLIARRLMQIPYIGLPNILAGRFIVPELISPDLNRENLAGENIRMLKSDEYRERIKIDLGDAVESLGEGGAIQRAARAVIALAVTDEATKKDG